MQGRQHVSHLDLSDPYVREMADRHHQPEEHWFVSGDLASVNCETCKQSWPCGTRRLLNELPAAGQGTPCNP